MELIVKQLSSLFAQLGEADDEQSIARFIALHGEMPGHIHLHEAGFWSSAQSSFPRESHLLDAAWSQVVDELNIKLHQTSETAKPVR